MATDYAKIAQELRREVLALVHKGQTSHIASNFSLIDIVAVLYENLQPFDEVIWSKGWASALYYIIGIRQGKLNREEVFNTFPNFPYLALLEPPIHPIATGAVGHGLPFSVGLALAKKMKGEEGVVYCILSDGELNEGTVWESAMLAKHHQLNNLVVIVDQNGWQAMGKTSDVLDVNPEKIFKGFGWLATTINGHDHKQLESSLTYQQGSDLPWALICNTVKGKGVSFMQNHLLYHYKHVDDETYQKALSEL